MDQQFARGSSCHRVGAAVRSTAMLRGDCVFASAVTHPFFSGIRVTEEPNPVLPSSLLGVHGGRGPVLAETFYSLQEPVMTMRTFVEFWKGMFFFVSTLMVSVIFYLVVVKWQPLWTEGFKDFAHIRGYHASGQDRPTGR